MKKVFASLFLFFVASSLEAQSPDALAFADVGGVPGNNVMFIKKSSFFSDRLILRYKSAQELGTTISVVYEMPLSCIEAVYLRNIDGMFRLDLQEYNGLLCKGSLHEIPIAVGHGKSYFEEFQESISNFLMIEVIIM